MTAPDSVLLDLLKIAGAGACLALGLFCIRLLILVRRAGAAGWEHNRARTGGFLSALRGRVKGGGPLDPDVRTGIAYDARTNEWVPTGSLSDEAILRNLQP